MSKGVHVAHNKLEANLQDQRGQGGHGAIPLSAGMLLVTLGVVYGDIGTSPMYTMKSIVANNGGIGTVSEDMILGALSLVIWTMTLVTTVKYVIIAMKADNHNEGGIFALFSLVRKVAPWLILPAMIGGAALLADGILTPAVTVTTAIEGLRTIEWGHALLGDGQTNVIIITIIIICGLFAMQRAGTSSIGKLFGPLMTLWFLFLAGAGLFNMLGNLSILRALNPIRGIMFLFSPINHSGIMVLGFVFLSTTGAEALYSDMGHVGKANIYASWPFVKAALILNYLGQGAWLLANNSNPQMLAMDIVNPFYMMLPEPLRPFAIVLSAVAAIIASQALITGSFSLVSEATRLNLMPHLRIHYPSDTKGQLYIPLVNNIMWVGCIFIVLLFQNSERMESAYGLAITVTMLMTTTLLTSYIAGILKHKLGACVFALLFGAIELCFFASCLTMFFDGGYVMIFLAALLFGLMYVWRRGTAIERTQSMCGAAAPPSSARKRSCCPSPSTSISSTACATTRPIPCSPTIWYFSPTAPTRSRSTATCFIPSWTSTPSAPRHIGSSTCTLPTSPIRMSIPLRPLAQTSCSACAWTWALRSTSASTPTYARSSAT